MGKAADWLVNQGATVILSEITEMIGTEHILAGRASSPAVAEQIVNLIKRQRQQAVDFLGDWADLAISPGNIEGGLSNITEKSLGCIVKGGTTPIKEVIDYAASPSQKGLVIMDTPGSDIFSLTGMAAGGTQLMIFTTGRGTPVGFPIAPVVKIASNTQMYENMKDDMDINAGTMIERKENLEKVGRRIYRKMLSVASGEETRSEVLGHDEFSIFKPHPSF